MVYYQHSVAAHKRKSIYMESIAKPKGLFPEWSMITLTENDTLGMGLLNSKRVKEQLDMVQGVQPEILGPMFCLAPLSDTGLYRIDTLCWLARLCTAHIRGFVVSTFSYILVLMIETKRITRGQRLSPPAEMMDYNHFSNKRTKGDGSLSWVSISYM